MTLPGISLRLALAAAAIPLLAAPAQVTYALAW